MQSQSPDQDRQPEEGATGAETQQAVAEMQAEHSGSASGSGAVRINGVADLLPLLRGVPVKYRFDKHNAILDDSVAEGGYACACASDCDFRRRGKALSALQFEKHAGAASKNQNDHILLPNGTSLYALFQKLRDVPVERFADDFRMAAGVPMTVPTAPIAPPASTESDTLQASDVTVEQTPPAAAAQEGQTSEMLTEEEKAIMSLLDLREHNPATESDPMDGVEWPSQIHHSLSLIDAAEEIENAARGDHEMPDVVEVRITGDEQPSDNDLSTSRYVKVQVMETKHQPVQILKKKHRKKKYRPVLAETKYKPDSLLREVRGLLFTGLLEGFRVAYRRDGAEITGRIVGQGYSCGCSRCGYSTVMNACEFEQHAGKSTNNQNDHIFLETGISLYKLIQPLKYKRLDLLGDLIEEQTGLPPNLIEYEKWKASFQVKNNDSGAAASDPCSTQCSPESPVRITGGEQPSDNDLSTSRYVKVQVMETKHQPVQILKKKHRKKKYRPVLAETRYRPVRVTETKYKPDSLLREVRGLLFTGLLEGFRVAYRRDGAEITGRIVGQGYSCGCSRCGYSTVMNACEFEQHAGKSTNNQNDHIFLETGISLYKLIQPLKYKRLDLLGDLIEEQTGLPPNLIEYEKWKASFQVKNNDSGAAASDPCSTQCSQESPAGVATHITRATTSTSCLKKSTSNHIPNLDWSAFRRPRWQYKQGSAKTSALTLSRSPEKETLGLSLSTRTAMESDTEETPSKKTAGPLSSEIIKPNFRRPRWQYKRESTKTSAPTLSRSPDKGTPGLSTGTLAKSDTEETPSKNTEGPLSSEVIKPNFSAAAAVISASLPSPVSVVQEPPLDHSVEPKAKESRTSKVRDNTLHPLVFKEGGLPEFTLLTYKLKHGEVLKQGYKRGSYIVCDCCNEELTPSQFEDHAGMGKRRQPYRNIYTPEGLTLHELALKLQDSLNSNGVSSVDFSDIDDPPNIASSDCSKEHSTTSRPIIVPFKRTLQERVIESCHLCGNASTTVGKISEDMIIFCNQCERPCHVKCYNNGLQEKKAPLNVLGEYMKFLFFCCKKCQLLHASLHQILNNREKIRHKRSNVCWHLLSGMNLRRDVQHYMNQIIGIFKVAFPGTDAHEIEVIQDMVTGTDLSNEKKDFRGVYCAVLTTSSKLVLSAAILKVRTEEVAELVLVATHPDCRNKGYFRLLLRKIEAHLTTLNVRLLTAPVDPEMAPIWSKKLGFTVLSNEEESSLLEAQPLVMFQDLTLMQKPLASKQLGPVVSTDLVTITELSDPVVSANQVTVTELSDG